MNARTVNAFMLSAMLHALFAAAMLYMAYALKSEMIDKAKVMELVAGEGDNWQATEAPALGTAGGVRFAMPNVPAPPTPAPEPVMPAAPEPAPVQAVAPPKAEPPPMVEPKPIQKAIPKPEPSPVSKADTKKAEPVVPDLVKGIKRVQVRMAVRQKAQRDKEAKAAAQAAALAAKQAEINARKAELMKAGGGQIKVSKIDAEGIAKGVIGGSPDNKVGGAGGKALSREEQDLLETYFALLKQHLREAHEKPSGLSDLIAARAEFYVGADGSISRARIVQSSGNTEFDESVLAAIRNVRTIGPRPDGKGDVQSVRFRMKDEE